MKKIYALLHPHIESILSPHRPTDADFEILKEKNAEQLASLLNIANGFMAFKNALIILSAQEKNGIIDVFSWNKFECWKSAFNLPLENYFFFGMDIFGYQFGIEKSSSKIFKFDPEDSSIHLIGENLETWLSQVINDPDIETGMQIAKIWSLKNPDSLKTNRLVPLQFFILGGTYSLDNLKAYPLTEALTLRASIANQISKLPDGSNIRFE